MLSLDQVCHFDIPVLYSRHDFKMWVPAMRFGAGGQPERVQDGQPEERGAVGSSLKAVLAFMYTERLDVAIEEVDAVLRVARKCRMHAVVKAIGEEMRTLKYYFKSTRRDEAPRRFKLLPPLICQ